MKIFKGKSFGINLNKNVSTVEYILNLKDQQKGVIVVVKNALAFIGDMKGSNEINTGT